MLWRGVCVVEGCVCCGGVYSVCCGRCVLWRGVCGVLRRVVVVCVLWKVCGVCVVEGVCGVCVVEE